MGDIEMTVGSGGFRGKIFFVKAVGDAGDGRFRERRKVFLHERGARKNGAAAIQHMLFHSPEPVPGAGCHGQVLEIVHLAPRVPEVRNPGNAGGFMKPEADEMDRVRRPRGYDGVYGVLLQIPQQSFHRGLHPAHARIRHKEIGPHPEGKLLFPGLFPG